MDFSSNPSYAVVTQLLHGLTSGRLYIVSSAHTSEAAEEEKRAALSLYTIFMNARGGLVGNYLLAGVLSPSNPRACVSPPP